jgi:hypothetical protein
MSSAPISSGESVSFRTSPRAALSLGEMGAVSGSANTAWVISVPSTVDATAPWAPVQ